MHDLAITIVIVGGILIGVKMLVMGWMREIDKNRDRSSNGNS